ncbi:MAG: hypothetical protein AAFQ94_06210 [Bacteroidota bacterium]
MKNLAFATIFSCLVILFGCGQDSENTESITYELPSGPNSEISGSMVVSKNDDGSATFFIKLTGTIQGFEYPTHLHYGDLSVADAKVAALLTPTSGDTGISETVVSLLSDDTAISYDDILSGQYSVKIHLGDNTEDKQVIIAASNVGAAFDEFGTKPVAVCGSN